MITGSVVVDFFFSTGGIGRSFVDSALNRDYAVMLGITILCAPLILLMRSPKTKTETDHHVAVD